MSVAMSQNVSDYVNYGTKYKDKDIVYLNVKTEVTVDITKTDLKIEETKSEEIYYNNYKAGAFSEGDVESTHFTKLKDIEASTLLPDNNKFKELKVKEFKTKEVLDEDVFYQDLFSTSFIYPSLRQGAITKLKYTLEVKEPHFFPHEILERYFPIENFEFVINSDKDVEFEIKYFNTDSSNIEFTKVEKGSRIIYTWKAKNIHSYKTEDRAPNYLYFLPQIIPYIKSYKLNDKEVTVFRNTDDLFKWYNANTSKIDRQHTPEMISTVNNLVKDCKTELDKVAVIYQWVQSNIKYVANEYGLGGFVPRNPYQIFDKRYGDCKDMASIIIELLDIAGVKAYQTWIGTRELPYSYTDIPTALCSNHMIAAYIQDGKYYFLDATNSYIPLGLPSSFIQGKEAMIRMSDDKYEVFKVPEVAADTNFHADSVNLSIDQGKILGKGVMSLGGYYFSSMKQNIERIKDATDRTKFMKSYLETGNNKCVIDKYDINSSTNNIHINYEFNLADHLVVNGNEMYLNLNLSQPYDNFDLFKDERKLDYEFVFRSLIRVTYIFTIPDNYEVSFLPKNSRFDNKDFYYHINYEIKGNKILYHLYFNTDTMVLKPSQFPLWNKMLKQMRSDYKEAVVLKKKL